MEEKPFTERWKEQVEAERSYPRLYGGMTPTPIHLTWSCVKEIEALRQEIVELKKQNPEG